MMTFTLAGKTVKNIFTDGRVDPVRHDRHALGGTVQHKGKPMAGVLVIACNRYTLAPIAVTRSHLDGSWRIEGMVELPVQSIRIITHSDDPAYNGVLADWVSQGAPHPPAPEQATS